MRCSGTSLLAVALAALTSAGWVAAQAPQEPTSTGYIAPNSTMPARGGELYDAYATVTEMSVWLNSGKAHLTQDMLNLAEQTKDIYRSAHKAFMEGDPQRAADLSLAADSAGRGLLLVMHALMPLTQDIPAPPEPANQTVAAPPSGKADRTGPAPERAQERATQPRAENYPERAPWEPARNALRAARASIRDAADNQETGPGQNFLNESRNVYEMARRAYTDRDYLKATQLAWAADAWTHVGSYLSRANVQGTTSGAERGGRETIPPPPTLDQSSRPSQQPPTDRPPGDR